jgi:lipopolysaccharide export system protein LptC
MAYTDREAGSHSFINAGRDSDRAYRGAARHSRRVRLLRVLIPVFVVVALAVIALASWLNPLRLLSDLPIDIGRLVVSGTKITMEAPRLAGYTRDQRAYELSARAAAQDITKPDLVELRDIRAKLDMQDKSMMEMTAVTGTYDAKSEMLTLGQNILLSSSTGYEGRLSEAIIDIRKGNIVSDKPVEVKMLQGTLNANRLEVKDAGDVVRFDGGVNMIMNLKQPGDEQKAASQ